MSVARSAAEVLRDHVVLEVEAIDRMYLNVYVPHLQSVGAVVGYLRVHRGQRFASTTAVTPMTEAFVRNIDRFVNDEGVDLVAFQKGQRKDDVTQKYVRKFTRREGVLYVGKAQEKARVMRTERRCSRFTGGTHPWIVESTAMVNHYNFLYKYALDLTVGLRRGGCPTKLVVRRHAAGSIFSLANGKASRKVCIGVLPKHQRP